MAFPDNLTYDEKRFLFTCILECAEFTFETNEEPPTADTIWFRFDPDDFVDYDEHVVFSDIYLEGILLTQEAAYYNNFEFLMELAAWVLENYKEMGFSLELERAIHNVWYYILMWKDQQKHLVIPPWFFDNLRHLENLVDSYKGDRI